METCRFGVRRETNGGSDACFEVFDRVTGAAVASGMRRVEAEAEAHRRNHDTSSWPPAAVRLAPVELAGLRAELAHADRLVAEQQARIGKLYELFTGRDGDRR